MQPQLHLMQNHDDAAQHGSQTITPHVSRDTAGPENYLLDPRRQILQQNQPHQQGQLHQQSQSQSAAQRSLCTCPTPNTASPGLPNLPSQRYPHTPLQRLNHLPLQRHQHPLPRHRNRLSAKKPGNPPGATSPRAASPCSATAPLQTDSDCWEKERYTAVANA